MTIKDGVFCKRGSGIPSHIFFFFFFFFFWFLVFGFVCFGSPLLEHYLMEYSKNFSIFFTFWIFFLDFCFTFGIFGVL